MSKKYLLATLLLLTVAVAMKAYPALTFDRFERMMAG
jgi:hypothetical protein